MNQNQRRLDLLRRRSSRDPLVRAVRDAALGQHSSDLDLAAGPGALRLVRQLARTWGKRAFRFRKRAVTPWRFVVDERRVDLVDASRRGLPADLAQLPGFRLHPTARAEALLRLGRKTRPADLHAARA